jgi:HPt (histidine-containing phosphotransfer) domain-containing protein
MDDWVSKPLRPKELFKAMHTLLTEVTAKPEDQHHEEDAVIDIKTALEIFGDNKKLLKKTIEIYLNRSPQVLEELVQAMHSNDKELIYNALHKLKGSFPAFIPQNILAFFVNLEQSAREGSLSGLDKKLERIKKYQNMLIEKFKGLLEDLSET